MCDSETVMSDDTKHVPKPSYRCCPMHCVSRLDDVFKSQLLSSMSKLTRSEKRIYLFTMISLRKDNNERPKKDTKSRRKGNLFLYTVKEYGITRQVCRDAFIRLHGTTAMVIQTLCHKMETDEFLLTFGCVKPKKPRRDSMLEETRKLIKDHLFGILESPVFSEFGMKKLGQVNRTKLWLDFKQKYITGSDVNLHVGKTLYFKHINSYLTPDVQAKFMTTQQAYKIHQKSLEMIRKTRKL